MNIAHTLIVESGRKVRRVTLKAPMDLFEIRDKFKGIGQQAMIFLSPDGIARVSFIRSRFPGAYPQKGKPEGGLI